MRLSLLMEIERRRQSEETLEQIYVHWRSIREQLAHTGVFLPLDPTSSQYSLNIADELRCQLKLARYVSESLSNSLAKAEVEMEMESKLKAKNFEITRLSDRLRHYDTLDQEMSQRNQEAIDKRNFKLYLLSFLLSQCFNFVDIRACKARGRKKKEEA